MGNKKDSNKEMNEKLAEFRKKEISPTAALVNPIKVEKERFSGVRDEDIFHLIKKKEKMEDTHTRRTFLVKNELLERLDLMADKLGRTGFKTEFINHVIDKGLNDLEAIKNEREI